MQYGNPPGVQWVYRHKVDNVDNDLWVYDFDNCPNVWNNDQTDTNHNGVGDACDGCPSCCAVRLPNGLVDGERVNTYYSVINSSVTSQLNPYFWTLQVCNSISLSFSLALCYIQH